MARRFLPITAFLMCACASVWAAERATFIMADGARKSGTLVAHGGHAYNLIDENFNLAVEGGREESYPESAVAVIDMAGGQPPVTELQTLPMGPSQMLVLRSGYSQEGRLVNIVNGDTVLWRNEGGQEQRYAARDVARIYLNPQIARLAYGYSGQSPQPAAVGTAGQMAGTTIRIDGNVPWVDTGVTVRRGDRMVFNASGGVSLQPGTNVGPAGTPTLHGNYPVRNGSAGALIGRVGNGAPFQIGSNQPITMSANGRLMIGINDDNFSDNSGFFSVTISQQ